MAEEFIVTLIVLAILGLFNSGYLIKSRKKKQPAVCPIDGGCEKVLESRWNSLLGIKNDAIGCMYYFLIAILAFGLFIISKYQHLFILYEKLALLIKAAAGIALLFSLILTYIQIKKIKEFCFYCLVSALISLLIFINTLAL